MFYKVVIFGLLFSAGNALQCYKCESKSQSECESKQNADSCKPGASRCLTAQHKVESRTSTKTFFTKMCSTSDEECRNYCKDLPDNVKDCQMLDCCEGDLCNTKYEKKINRKRSATESHGVPMYRLKTGTLLTILSALTLVCIIN